MIFVAAKVSRHWRQTKQKNFTTSGWVRLRGRSWLRQVCCPTVFTALRDNTGKTTSSKTDPLVLFSAKYQPSASVA